MHNQKLAELGLTLSAMLIRDQYNGIKGQHTHAVVIHYGDESMSLEFTSGSGNRHHPRTKQGPVYPTYKRLTVYDLAFNKQTVPNVPELADVMYSVLSDSSVGRNSMSFAEFCEDYGYDEDSRSAFKIYEACMDQYSKLRQLGVDLEALDEILEDY